MPLHFQIAAGATASHSLVVSQNLLAILCTMQSQYNKGYTVMQSYEGIFWGSQAPSPYIGGIVDLYNVPRSVSVPGIRLCAGIEPQN